jgi:glycosyltransferase involved in cell wall biosynthesis
LDSAKLLSQQLGLSDRVRYLGFRRDVPELLAAADLLVLPCEREGLPVCVMEALAMNKPVIGANARGTRDLLAPDCGWLHEVGDVKMLAEQIDYVLSHPDEARQRAGQGRKRILAEYGWEPVRDKLIDIYRRLGIMVKS